MNEVSEDMINWVKQYATENHISVKITFDVALFCYFIEMKLGARKVEGEYQIADMSPVENDFFIKDKIRKMYRKLVSEVEMDEKKEKKD